MTTSSIIQAPTPVLTLQDVSDSVIGRLVTWEQLIGLIHEAHDIQVTFGIKRDGTWSGGSISVTKEKALERAENGRRWSREKGEEQKIRVSATKSVLWFGAAS